MDNDDLSKKYKRHCPNCNTRFSILYDEDTTEQRVTVCPFCSYELEDELDEQEEEVTENEDEHSEASWD